MRDKIRNKLDFHSCGTSRSVEWQFRTDVSGQAIGPILKGQSDLHRLSQNFGTELPFALRKIPEEHRSHLHCVGSWNHAYERNVLR